MLSLWKLRVGAEAYYLSQVARGIDDYYSGAGETAGRWFGTGSDILNLPDAVDGDDLRAILAGLVPGTGLSPNGTQIRAFKDRVPGFDLTFSAPKSVSVMYAFADPIVRAEVVAAVDAAVEDAMSWLEREACFVRRGSNNRRSKVAPFETWGTRRLPGAGFIAAGFRHRTSRAGDPQLHTHVLIANLTRGPDGRWSALDGQALYRSKLAAGVVFQTALRDEMTRRLGVRWRPVHDHVADIAGIPQKVLTHFSKRRNEIEGELERTGQAGPAAADRATLATRREKVEIDQETLDGQWRVDGATVSFRAENINQLLSNSTGRPPITSLTADSRVATRVTDRITGEIHEQLLTIDQFALSVAFDLPERSATVTRLEVQSAVADHLLGNGGAVVLERLTDAVLAHPELVLIPQPTTATAAGWEQRWTTRRMIEIESKVLGLFTPTDNQNVALNSVSVDEALAEFSRSLGPDQIDAVRRICTQGLDVEVVVGRAGTGKTYTMNAVRHVLHAHGHRLVGVCPTGRAARELADGAGIDAYTVPRLFTHADLTAGDVLVVDETGMCGTLDLHRILTHTRTVGAKVVLVGDHRQLPEITAGGGFRAALDAVGDRRCELAINRRQIETWEHVALDQLRDGDIDTFWTAYRDHDRIHLTPTADQLHADAIDGWWNHHTAGYDAHLIAGTRAEARLINRLARQRADGAGLLTGTPLIVRERMFQVGDRVVLLTNAPGQVDLETGQRCRVDNGMIATIDSINHVNGDVDITISGGQRRIRLTGDYVHSGAVDHGYATTIHKAQGVTCDHIHVVGPAGLYREAAYVSLSRARLSAHLYATTRDAAAIGEPAHTTGIPLASENLDDPEADITSTISESRAKQFITAEHPDLDRIADLATNNDLAALNDQLRLVRTVIDELTEAGNADPMQGSEELRLAEEHRRRMSVGERVNARDWDNVGTIERLHDTIGHASVRFVSESGQITTRRLPWHLLRPIDRPHEVDLTDLAVTYFGESSARIEEQRSRWIAELADRRIDPDEPTIISAAIQQRREQVARALRATPPTWLTWWTGVRPSDPTAAIVYDDLIADLAHWRDEQRIPASEPGFGSRPADPEVAERWRRHLDRALATRDLLLRTKPVPAPTLPTLDAATIRFRLDELDALLATAPTDQRHIVNRLLSTVGEGLTDIVEALRAANAGQQVRRDWILEHWPHIVEHHELTKLSSQLPPLAHVTIDGAHSAADQLAEARSVISAWMGEHQPIPPEGVDPKIEQRPLGFGL